ncbi:unnamed protein product [Microthlaspi erraticum]|uniref:Retrotransposon gag domain-containing protein n=1 Tax=Microthlaspi erraticum TaxID=1685480 RepID=A0A6D2LAY1_9BRAS|nr:unnamed protein product [Microthlaspi erraticum]
MAQGKDESLRKFVERFKTAAAEHSDIPDDGNQAFENGLWFESKLKESLMLDEPATLQDALHRSQKYVCVEESKAHHSKIHGMTKDRLACIISSRGSDESKWCKLHGRTDHTTEECRRINSMILEYGNTPQSQMMLNAATKIDELQTSAKVEIRRAKIEDDDAEKNAPASLPHQDDLPPPPKRQVR